jgi:hypothetical protein
MEQQRCKRLQQKVKRLEQKLKQLVIEEGIIKDPSSSRKPRQQDAPLGAS